MHWASIRKRPWVLTTRLMSALSVRETSLQCPRLSILDEYRVIKDWAQQQDETMDMFAARSNVRPITLMFLSKKATLQTSATSEITVPLAWMGDEHRVGEQGTNTANLRRRVQFWVDEIVTAPRGHVRDQNQVEGGSKTYKNIMLRL